MKAAIPLRSALSSRCATKLGSDQRAAFRLFHTLSGRRLLFESPGASAEREICEFADLWGTRRRAPHLREVDGKLAAPAPN
jgi:hypothetical protein